jgi:DNA-binding beta-propeller fold protein YncE
MDAANIIVLEDSYVFASSTTGKNSPINVNDSLVIMKLDLDGETIWKSSQYWQDSIPYIIDNIGASSIASNQNCLTVTSQGNDFVMVFDAEGNFIKRNKSDLGYGNFISAIDNNYFVIGGGDGRGRLELEWFDIYGEKIWSKTYANRNLSCISKGSGAIVKSSIDDKLLFLGTVNKNCDSYPSEKSLYLVKTEILGEVL